MKIAHLLLRVSIGGLFVGHGTQKLFGWFGGHGLDATAEGFEALSGSCWALAALAAGALGSYGAHLGANAAG